MMGKNISSIAIGFAAALLAQSAVAGGFLEIEGAVFAADSNEITNPWWSLPEGTRLTYFAVDGDECALVYEDVLSVQSRTHVGAVAIREVLDEAWIDEDCDMIPDELVETTLDWYAQDTLGNVWYFGEDTTSFDGAPGECDHPGDGGCKDGSWEAGADVAGVGSIAKEGILMLADPTKESGVSYFQEIYEGEALDAAKILNYKNINTFLYGKQSGCVRIKEYSALAPGAVEHKTYCKDLGLVLVEENAGGKTVFETLVDVGPTP
jgi:hypothetical protein